MADDTRSRIQAIALDLFSEQGYDATSLREIAERLGVTKAALYYHFKSKEEIVESLTSDHVARLETLLEWAEGKEPTTEFRLEFLHRYLEKLNTSQHFKIMKFIQQNQPAMKNMANAAKWRESLQKMITALAGPKADSAEKMRMGLALFGLHASGILLPDVEEDDRRQAALTVAEELITGSAGRAN